MAKNNLKARRLKEKGSRRVSAIILTFCIGLASIFLFGGSIGSYHVKGYLPKIEHWTKGKTAPVRSTKQANSGLYFSDGSAIPAYSGKQSIDINGGVPFFTVGEKNLTNSPTFTKYSGNDYLGRATGVVSVFSRKDLISSKGRPELPNPPGWVSRTKGGIYDRSHLKAYTFAGSNNLENLITGTISLNQKYMVEVENATRDFLEKSNQSVIYRVTPYYLGDELVPRGVLMEVYSSTGSLSICKYIYNIQDGFTINYSNGTVSAD